LTTIKRSLRVEVEEILRRAGIAEASEDASAIVDAANRQTLGDDVEQRARDLAERRAAGTPLAYVVGRTSFMGVELMTVPGALVPRAETELLGQTAVGTLGDDSAAREVRVIDMCCGSGNLACAIAISKPTARVWACDLTDGAVAVARMNVAHHGLEPRVVVRQGDLFGPLLESGLENTIDLVVCNPPYISTGKLTKESSALVVHEPLEAFDGGPYGLSIFQRVIRESLAFLKPYGFLLFEIGVGQERQVSALFDRAGEYDRAIQVPDSQGQIRVVGARKRPVQ